jgi:hypothetical protein
MTPLQKRTYYSTHSEEEPERPEPEQPERKRPEPLETGSRVLLHSSHLEHLQTS